MQGQFVGIHRVANALIGAHGPGPSRVIVPAALRHVDSLVAIAVGHHHLTQQLDAPKVDAIGRRGIVRGQCEPIGMGREPIHVRTRTGVVHGLQECQVIHAPLITRRRHCGRQTSREHLHLRRDGLDRQV